MSRRSIRPAAILPAAILTLALAAGTTSAQAAGQQLRPTSYNLYFGDLHAHAELLRRGARQHPRRRLRRR